MLFLVGKEVFDSDLVCFFFFLPPLALSPVFRYTHQLFGGKSPELEIGYIGPHSSSCLINCMMLGSNFSKSLSLAIIGCNMSWGAD